MIKKFKNIIFLISFIIFTFLTINYYFSEENMIHINKSRSTYTLTLYNNIPLLKNDTNNIIVYKQMGPITKEIYDDFYQQVKKVTHDFK